MRSLRWILLIAAAGGLWVWFHYEPDRTLEELSAYTNAQSRFIDIDGQRMHYRREGTPGAPVLVLLHGNSASLHTWDGWVDALDDDFDVVRLDLPGFGLTGPSPERDYHDATYVRVLSRFIETLDIDRFALAGNSLGGNIAWQYTLEKPERVDKLILIDPSGMPQADTPVPFVFRLARVPVLSNALTWFAPESLYRNSLLEVYGDDSLVTDTLVQRYRDLSLFAGNRQAFVDAGLQFDSAPIDRLGEISTPTLILWGAKDAWIPVSDGERFQSALPNSELIIYPELGHVPMEESPARTAADARRFLLTDEGAHSK